MKNGDTNMDLLKAIKAAKDVYIDVALKSTTIWVKVNKKEFLESFIVNKIDINEEIEIVTQYGKSAIYLGQKL